MSDHLRRLVESRLSGAGRQLPDDVEAQTMWPNLWACLTWVDASDEMTMDPASLTIRLGIGEFVVDLSHPGIEATNSTSAPTLRDAFSVLEAQLASGRGWKPWKGSSGSFKPRKKKT